MALGMIFLSTLIAMLSAAVTAISGGSLLLVAASYIASSLLAFTGMLLIAVAREVVLSDHNPMFAVLRDKVSRP